MIGKIHIAMLGVGLALFLGPQLTYASPADDYQQFRKEHHGRGHHHHGHGHGHDCDDFDGVRGRGHHECDVSKS